MSRMSICSILLLTFYCSLHIGAEPSKSAAAIGQAKPSLEKEFLASARAFCKKTSNTSSPASNAAIGVIQGSNKGQQFFSFNATQQDKNPPGGSRTARLSGSGKRPWEGCTKWNDRDLHVVGVGWWYKGEDNRIQSSCTQCAPDKAFTLVMSKSREGTCIEYKPTPQQYCINLDEHYDHYENSVPLWLNAGPYAHIFSNQGV